MFTLNPTPRKVDYIFYEGNFLKKDEISQVQSQILSLEFMEGRTGRSKEADNFRRSKIKWIPGTKEWKWLYNKIIDKTFEVNKNHWDFDISIAQDRIQYSQYEGGDKGHYDWHIDVGPGVASYRKLSIVIPLTPSNSYEGGDLEFVSQQPISDQDYLTLNEVGSISIFPSFILHKVNPVITGMRNSLVMWVGGVPFR